MAADKKAFAYAILRLVPCLERGETLNVGVCLFCRQFDFLEMRTRLNRTRLNAVDADLDIDAVSERLADIEAIIRGAETAGALALMPPSERFGWLTAPSSTMIQTSEVHTGITGDPESELDRLFASLVP